MGVNDPKKVHLKKGDQFPSTSNKDRKWKQCIDFLGPLHNSFGLEAL